MGVIQALGANLPGHVAASLLRQLPDPPAQFLALALHVLDVDNALFRRHVHQFLR